MATKKTDTKSATKSDTTKKPAKAKAETVTYKGQKYTVLDRNDRKVCLTDGTIHFWARVGDVEIK